MSAWRREAFERLPECRTQLQEAENSYAYWIDLKFVFEDAFRKGDFDLFKRILEYLDWCLEQPRSKMAEDDLPTCVYVCFMEHFPEISTDLDVRRLYEVLQKRKTNS